MAEREAGHRRVALGPGEEFDLIRRLLGPEDDLPPEVLVGPGDDGLVVEGGWVLSTDLAVEDVHFRRDWVTLEEAAYRAVAGGLSDLAAMAAEPVGVLLSLALHPSAAAEEAPLLQAGADDACRDAGCRILGGDLARSRGPLMVSVVALGRADSPVLRTGCRSGDEVWVTGRLGGSGGAVALWSRGEEPSESLRGTFVAPRPRIREAVWLSRHVTLHGLIDLSDGLAGDAGHLAAASGVSVILDPEAIPIHPHLRETCPTEEDALDLSLRGGEDFELCLTVPPGVLDELVGPFQDSFGIPLSRVGRVETGEGVFLLGKGKSERLPVGGGFNHFAGEEAG